MDEKTLEIKDASMILPPSSKLLYLPKRNLHEEKSKKGCVYNVKDVTQGDETLASRNWKAFQNEVKMIKFVMQNVVASHSLWLLLEMPLSRARVSIDVLFVT